MFYVNFGKIQIKIKKIIIFVVNAYNLNKISVEMFSISSFSFSHRAPHNFFQEF